MIPSWLKNDLNSEERTQIENAVREAEKNTSGEIVPMIVRSSSTVGHVPLLVYTVMLLLFYVSGIYDYTHETFESPWWWTVGWSVLMLPVSFLFSKIAWVQRACVNSLDRELQTRMRAMNEFYNSKLDETNESTGILLYVSFYDHKAVVLADKAISDKLPKETWSEVVNVLINGAKKKDLGVGFVQAIEMCNVILKEHFPIKPDDINELPNHLIIKE